MSEVTNLNSVMVAAHELKAPLSTLRQLAFSLQDAEERAVQRRICDQMVDLSERALLQINDLAKLSRLEDGLFTMEPVSVRSVCETVMHDIRPFYRYEHRQFQLRYRNRQKLALANPELLYSVIYNLCTNAAHCSTTENASILTVRDTHGSIQIGVRDFGSALPDTVWRSVQLGRIDQPLPISMRPGSSSLGFYISSRFVQHMHAQLRAIRHRDGTSFLINLPVSSQASLFEAL